MKNIIKRKNFTFISEIFFSLHLKCLLCYSYTFLHMQCTFRSLWILVVNLIFNFFYRTDNNVIMFRYMMELHFDDIRLTFSAQSIGTFMYQYESNWKSTNIFFCQFKDNFCCYGTFTQ